VTCRQVNVLLGVAPSGNAGEKPEQNLRQNAGEVCRALGEPISTASYSARGWYAATIRVVLLLVSLDHIRCKLAAQFDEVLSLQVLSIYVDSRSG